jgi:hypothetical protein
MKVDIGEVVAGGQFIGDGAVGRTIPGLGVVALSECRSMTAVGELDGLGEWLSGDRM